MFFTTAPTNPQSIVSKTKQWCKPTHPVAKAMTSTSTLLPSTSFNPLGVKLSMFAPDPDFILT